MSLVAKVHVLADPGAANQVAAAYPTDLLIRISTGSQSCKRINSGLQKQLVLWP